MQPCGITIISSRQEGNEDSIRQVTGPSCLLLNVMDPPIMESLQHTMKDKLNNGEERDQKKEIVQSEFTRNEYFLINLARKTLISVELHG